MSSGGSPPRPPGAPAQPQHRDGPAAPWVPRGWLPFFLSLSLISWEQEHCKYLTNPFSENRGNRVRSGLVSGKRNTLGLCLPPGPPSVTWAEVLQLPRGGSTDNGRRCASQCVWSVLCTRQFCFVSNGIVSFLLSKSTIY